MSFKASLRCAAALAVLAAASAAANAQTPTVQTSQGQVTPSTQDQLSQLTPEQAAQVQAIVEKMLAEKLAAMPAPVVDQLPPPPPAPTVATSWSGGSPRTTEEDRIFKINGRVMYDAFNLSTDDLAAVNQNYTRSFVRRAFLGVEGQFTQNWD